MGDPKKTRKMYETPQHPWKKGRLEEEAQIKRTYGLKNKREVWRVQTMVRRLRERARNLISARGENAKRLEKELIGTVLKLGLVGDDATTDDILALTAESVMDRRLQTVVYKKGLARSMKQARQFINHGHITLYGRRITSPGYLVQRDEMAKIGFYHTSTMADPNHVERVVQAASRPESEAPEEVEA